MSELPPGEGTYLVKLEEKIHQSWLHVMTVMKISNGHMTIIAGNFDFDMPKPIGWIELPDDEED